MGASGVGGWLSVGVLLLSSCGARSDLFPGARSDSDGPPPEQTGGGGPHSSSPGGALAGGSGGALAGGSGGALAGGAGGALAGGAGGTLGVAGSGDGGAGEGGANAAGEAGAGACNNSCNEAQVCEGDTCVCQPGAVALSGIRPRNAEAHVDLNARVVAIFSCPPGEISDPDSSMRVYAEQSGRLQARFPKSPVSNPLILQPERPSAGRAAAFFPGEQLTAWVGAALGGPFQTQFLGAVTHATSASFVDTGQVVGDFANIQPPALGDIDLDGDLDLVLPTPNGLVTLRNDGAGAFAVQPPQLPGAGQVWLADLDGDGDLDVAPDRFNDGSGNFTAGSAALDTAVRALGDLDGDGDLDLIEATDSTAAVAWNDGLGNFQDGPAFPGVVFALKLGDVDGDGDLDAIGVLRSDASTNGFLFRNEGFGNFSLDPAQMPTIAPRDLAMGDFDGDGDLDFFVVDWGWPAKGTSYSRLWRNDGSGNFSHDGVLYQAATAVATGDLDGDGDLDLVLPDNPDYSALPGRPSRVLLNDGSGKFVDSGNRLGTNVWMRGVLADFDGDSDLDAFLTERPHRSGVLGNPVWLNQ